MSSELDTAVRHGRSGEDNPAEFGDATEFGEVLCAALLQVYPDHSDCVRDRHILAKRLGLFGHEPHTLGEIAQELGLSRERIRQLQNRALTRLSTNGYAERHPATVELAQRLAQALVGGPDQPTDLPSLLSAAAEALPQATPALVVRLLGQLAGRGKHWADILGPDITRYLRKLAAAERETTRDELSFASAATRLDALYRAAAEIPYPGQAPDPDGHLPVRRMQDERETAGWFPSAKLGRRVYFESTTERPVLRLFERAPQVRWYCEQPVAIPYHLDGVRNWFVPDAVVVLDAPGGSGRPVTVLLEIKPLADMATTINLRKFRAARAWAAGRGWGWAVVDHQVRSLDDLATATVHPRTETLVRTALAGHGRLTYWHLRQLQQRVAVNVRDLAVLAVRNNWTFQRRPFELSTVPPPVH